MSRTHTSLKIWTLVGAAILLGALASVDAHAIPNTLFTYQGQLLDDGMPVDAPHARLLFRLWDSSAGGTQLGADWEVYPVEIVDGLFTAHVDFGETVFGEDLRYLEIGVDPSGGTAYQWFAERQVLTSTPLAILALNALHGGDSPWLLNGTAVYYDGGNVGVGTDSPAANLEVHGLGVDPVLKAQHDDEWGGTVVQAVVAGRGGTALHAQALGSSENYGLLSEVSSNISVAVLAENYDQDGGTAIRGSSAGVSGYGVVGIHSSATGSGSGVWGRTLSPDGWAGYFRGRGYFEGFLGVGTTSPSAELDVAGTARVDGFRLDTGAMPGYVLTSDASGIGSWQPTTGGGGLWQAGIGDDIYYSDGRVGIGINTPSTTLEVYCPGNEAALTARSGDSFASGTGVYAATEADDGAGLHAEARAEDGEAPAVLAETYSAQSHALHAVHHGTIGGNAVQGNAYGEWGIGVVGIHSSTTGIGKGVFGRSLSPDGYAGYFMGRGYFREAVGIGTDSPTTELEVDGTVKMTGFQLDSAPAAGHVLTSDATGTGSWQAPASSPWSLGTAGDIYYNGGSVGIGVTNPSDALEVSGQIVTDDLRVDTLARLTSLQMSGGAVAGHVLTSDASGNATWQAPAGGFELPIDESVSIAGTAFKITNNTGGNNAAVIHAVANNSYYSTTAGIFDATYGGKGIEAYSDNDPAVYAKNYGTGGFAIEGIGREGGGRFTSSNTGGRALDVIASGNQAYALRAEATGVESYGAYISSDHVGLYVSGATTGAYILGKMELHGKLALYDAGTLVMEMGKGLDYAEGFDVTEASTEIERGTVLVIDADNPGHLTRSTMAYDRKVAGIVAGADGLGSGVRLGGDQFDQDVALAGRVYCKVIAGPEGVEPGDLLTTSDVPGHAMKVSDHQRCQGAVLGKAMEPLAPNTKGNILVLVTLQ